MGNRLTHLSMEYASTEIASIRNGRKMRSSSSQIIKYNTKIDLVRACVFSVALYACETWTFRKAERTALLVFEMYCYRWLLHVKRLDKIRNSEIRRRLLVKEDLVQVVMRRKLSLFG